MFTVRSHSSGSVTGALVKRLMKRSRLMRRSLDLGPFIFFSKSSRRCCRLLVCNAKELATEWIAVRSVRCGRYDAIVLWHVSSYRYLRVLLVGIARRDERIVGGCLAIGLRQPQVVADEQQADAGSIAEPHLAFA